MTAIRVNLLLESEFRHQGAVSRKFTLRASLVLALAVVVLCIGFGMAHRKNVLMNLAASRERWSEIEPTYTNVRAMQQDLNHNEGLVAELNSWNESRIEWHEPLRALQRAVPHDIQLTQLAFRGSYLLLENPAEKPEDEPPPPTPARRFDIRFDGRAVGDGADALVNQFVTGLRQSEELRSALETLSLKGLQSRANQNPDEAAIRLFGIEGVSFARKME